MTHAKPARGMSGRGGVSVAAAGVVSGDRRTALLHAGCLEWPRVSWRRGKGAQAARTPKSALAAPVGRTGGVTGAHVRRPSGCRSLARRRIAAHRAPGGPPARLARIGRCQQDGMPIVMGRRCTLPTLHLKPQQRRPLGQPARACGRTRSHERKLQCRIRLSRIFRRRHRPSTVLVTHVARAVAALGSRHRPPSHAGTSPRRSSTTALNGARTTRPNPSRASLENDVTLWCHFG